MTARNVDSGIATQILACQYMKNIDKGLSRATDTGEEKR